MSSDHRVKRLAAAILMTIVAAGEVAHAFPVQSCGEQECSDCHILTRDEAKEILGTLVDDVLEVNPSEMKGLWEVVISKAGRKLPLYLDYTKQFLVSGELVRLRNMENLTGARLIDLNRIDVSLIPLEDALILGKSTARDRIVVFEDPECPFCQKLFLELKKAVEKRPDLAFYIKMLPLKIHPKAYEKAKAIICAKSLQLLEDSLGGKDLPAPSCKTDQLEKNATLAQQLNIASVPTLVYPDGMVIPGFTTAESLLQWLERAKSNLPPAGGR